MDVFSGGVGEIAAAVGLSILFTMRSCHGKIPITILQIIHRFKQRLSSTQSEPRHRIQFDQYLLSTMRKSKQLLLDLTRKRL